MIILYATHQESIAPDQYDITDWISLFRTWVLVALRLFRHAEKNTLQKMLRLRKRKTKI